MEETLKCAVERRWLRELVSKRKLDNSNRLLNAASTVANANGELISNNSTGKDVSNTIFIMPIGILLQWAVAGLGKHF